MSNDITLYKVRLKYLPKYNVGHVKRITRSFTCDPTVLANAETKAGKFRSLSAIIEALLDGWTKGTYVIEAANP